jgi:hypothetical protein
MNHMNIPWQKRSQCEHVSSGIESHRFGVFDRHFHSLCRNAAVEVLTALSRKVASVTVVAALAEMFLDIAEGSAGAKLKVASERASTVAVAAALVQTKKPCDGSTEAADPVLQRLAAIYKADASEEVIIAYPTST